MKTFIGKLIGGWCIALSATAQVPMVASHTDYNDKLYLTVTTPYVGHSTWYAVWAEASDTTIAAVFTNNNWGGGFDRCQYNRGTWVFEVLCGHGEERELKLLKGEVTCAELSGLGNYDIKYAKFVGWAPSDGSVTYAANIVEIGVLYKIYTQGNASFCKKNG